MKHIGIGLDFGNSNTTLAVFDGKEISYIRIDPSMERGTVMPSALYINRAYEGKTGSRALKQYLEDNTNRKIRLTEVNVGTIEVHMGEMDRDYFIERDRSFTAQLHARVDRDLPGRLFRGLKAFLGGEEEKRFRVFGKTFRLEALLNLLLRSLRESSEKEGLLINSLHVGRPVRYEGSKDKQSLKAISRMSEALKHAGFPNPVFMEEPVGAAWSYLETHELREGEILLVFDFGGGTLDLALLKVEEGAPRVLATRGLARAGDWIDREMYKSIIFPLLGKGVEIPHKRDDGSVANYLFPFSDFEEMLLNWQSTFLLNQARYLEEINLAIKEGGETAEKIGRLGKLIRCNGSFPLLKLMEQAKKELTRQETAIVDFDEAEIHVEISRGQFEQILVPLIRDIHQLIDSLMEQAGSPEVNRVVCAGGSSLIPVVRKVLEESFPGKVEGWDPFRSIAAGLALADYYSPVSVVSED
jgi:hypothetical chaperone protein